MGQCTSKHGAAVVASSNTNSHMKVQRGPSDSSMSKASSTYNNLAKFLEKHPPSPEGNKKRRRSSFFGTDSASAPVGEDLSCSLTFHMSSLEMSDRSNLMSLPGSVHSRRTSSKSPKRKISGGSRGPRRTISDESSSSLGGVRCSHNWAALCDTTDRDYGTNHTELDPLPEELAMRSSNTTSSGSAQAVAAAVGAQEVAGSDEEEKKQDSDDEANANEIQPRRRSRRRSSREWKRSSGIYQKRLMKDQEEGKEGEAVPKEGKESSWQALSCTSRNSDMYESYGSSNRTLSLLTFNDSFQNGGSSRRDLARYEKDAMVNMHGICFTESENEDESDSDDDDEGPVRAESQERRFWETHALRT